MKQIIIIERFLDKKKFHLKCYQPSLNQYIRKDDIYFSLKLPERIIVLNWIDKGNINFIPLDKPYHSPPNSIKHIDSTPPKLKRLGLEILKFIAPIELLQTIALVNKGFYHNTWEEELWQFYCLNEYKTNKTIPNWKNYYIEISMKSCFGCKITVDETVFYRCPFIKKPICYQCRHHNQKFTLLNKNTINWKYGINPNVLNLKFGDGQSREKITYQFLVIEALREYERVGKERILKEYQSNIHLSELKELIDAIDLTMITRCEYCANYSRCEHRQEVPAAHKDLVKNIFYPSFGKIFNYIRARDGGIKAIKNLI